MPHDASPSPRRPRARRRPGPLTLSAAALAALLALTVPFAPDSAVAVRPPAGAVARAPLSGSGGLAWMFDRNPVLRAEAEGFARPAGPTEPLLLQAAAALPAPPARVAQAAPPPEAAPVPLPVRRPAEFRSVVALAPAPAPAARAAARTPSTRAVFGAAAVDDRSFFEKLFGVGRSGTDAPRALAYAGADAGGLGSVIPRARLSPTPEPDAGSRTAIYDIGARSVYLPNGEVLEAHSGLGASMDDPRYVHLRMRGATPPGTYDLTEREALFHGVRAIRLNPVGGPAAIHGRTGILAHTYMLGPSGASNGCVSFRHYDRFLQAYLRGEVRRLVVVAGRGWDGPGGTRFGMRGRGSERDGG